MNTNSFKITVIIIKDHKHLKALLNILNYKKQIQMEMQIIQINALIIKNYIREAAKC